MGKREEIADVVYGMPPHQLVRPWNCFQSAINGKDIIYSMQSDFDNIISALPPMEIVKLVSEAEKDCCFSIYDDYFYYVPECGDFYTFDDPSDMEFFNTEDLIHYIASSNDDMGIPALHKVLSKPEIPEYEFKFILTCRKRTDNPASTMINLKDYIEIQTCGEYDMSVACGDVKKVE